MSLRVELLDVSERRAGLAALVRSIVRMALVAAAGGVVLLMFISGIQLWQRNEHVKALEDRWKLIEGKGQETDLIMRHLKHMEKTSNELESWNSSRIESAAILKSICIYVPTNMQITAISITPSPIPEDQFKPKFPGMVARRFTTRISGIVYPPAPNRSVTKLVDEIKASPLTSNIFTNAVIENYDANFKTPNDNSDFTFSILGHTHIRPAQ
jgi:hypothetical protein